MADAKKAAKQQGKHITYYMMVKDNKTVLVDYMPKGPQLGVPFRMNMRDFYKGWGKDML